MPHLLQPTLVWEGPFIDTWSIAHVIAGVAIAYALYFFAIKVSRLYGVLLAILFGIAWELLEQFLFHTRVTETLGNSVTDVVCAALGYLAGHEFFNSQMAHSYKNTAAVLFLVVFMLISTLRLLGA